jgi:hypothetical protein
VPDRGRGLSARSLLVTLAIVAALWSLPLLDELTGDYHNLRRMVESVGAPRANPWSRALPAAGDALLGFAGIPAPPGADVSPIRLAGSIALVVMMTLAGWRAARRRAGNAALALVTTAGLLAVVITARTGPGALRFAYVLSWAPVVGVSAGIVVLTEFLERAPRTGAVALARPGRAVLLLVALLLAFVQLRGLRSTSAPVRDPTSVAVEQTLLDVRRLLAVHRSAPPGNEAPRFLLRVAPGVDRDAVLGLILALDKVGIPFGVEPFGPYRLDGRLEPRGDERGELRIGAWPMDGTTVLVATHGTLVVTWHS